MSLIRRAQSRRRACSSWPHWGFRRSAASVSESSQQSLLVTQRSDRGARPASQDQEEGPLRDATRIVVGHVLAV